MPDDPFKKIEDAMREEEPEEELEEEEEEEEENDDDEDKVDQPEGTDNE